MKRILTLLSLAILLFVQTGFAQNEVEQPQTVKKNKAPENLAQSKLSAEVGSFVGMSLYAGDLTERYFEPLEAQFSVGLYYRQPFNKRWGLKANLMWGQLSGNDAHSSVESGLWKRNLRFTSDVYELSAVMEFQPISIESKYYKIAPYGYAGLGFFYFNPQTEMNGNTYNLHSYRTEGTEYSLFQYCIPFGGGLRVSINDRGSVGIEFGMRKTFTDYLDDVSNAYPTNIKDLQELNDMAFQLSYRAPTADSGAAPAPQPGEQRGNPNVKDWYMFFGVTVGFYLGK